LFNPIVNNTIVKLDPDTISQRLIESVSMVTDLLQSNRQLRDSINGLNKEKENIENDNCILQSDNLELRDRIEILESIIKANGSDYENYDWKKIIEEENDLGISSFKNSSNKGVENVASAMVEVKKENRMLNRRIEHLELQISHLTNHFDFQGNIEPTRTLMGAQKDMVMQHNSNEFMSEHPHPQMTQYDNGAYSQNYSNLPSGQNMRSTGFSKGRSNINSKNSLREGGRKLGRRDYSKRNTAGKKGFK
jgi:chaperonin cofactor prefoldin